jgi:hypothetical protein
VYHDPRTKQILSVTNEKSDRYEHGIEVKYEDVENLLAGTWSFKDYVVDYQIGSSKLSVLANVERVYVFKNTELTCIASHDRESECIVEWNNINQCWNFSLSQKYKKVYNGTFSENLVFFVTLETDFDFLIRTIVIDIEQLLSTDAVSIPFTTAFELHIDDISMSTRVLLKDYNLRITHE